MAHFVKGQGLVRTSFKSNVELRSANVDFVAGKYIVNPRAGFAEGLSSVTVNDESIGKALITNPASLTSIDLPAEYNAIGPKAFDGCSNLESIYIYAGQVISISEDAIPSGCTIYVDTAFLTEYQSLHPLLTFAGFDSGYTRTIPYVEGVTPTTLTAQYVRDWVAGLGDAKNSVGKVVVPAGFTDYEAGALDELFTQFVNLEEIESPWLNGTKTDGFSFSIPRNAQSSNLTASYLSSVKQADQSIFAYEINEVILPLSFTSMDNGVLTSAFPNTESFDLQGITYFDYSTFGYQHNNLTLKIPNATIPQTGFYNHTELKNLKLLAKGNMYHKFFGCALVEFELMEGSSVTNANYFMTYLTSLKKATMYASTITETAGIFIQCSNLEEVLMYGIKKSFSISDSTKFTRQALVDLINSLGTPVTQQTLTIGATNLAKLTAEDLAVATAKNWVVQ